MFVFLTNFFMSCSLYYSLRSKHMDLVALTSTIVLRIYYYNINVSFSEKLCKKKKQLTTYDSCLFFLFLVYHSGQDKLMILTKQ